MGGTALSHRAWVWGLFALAVWLCAMAQGAVAQSCLLDDGASGSTFGAAAGANGTACGANATAAGNSTAVGTFARALADSTTAVGTFSTANVSSGTAVGYAANALGAQTVALGFVAIARDSGAVAIGSRAETTGVNAIAIGASVTAIGDNQVAIGGAAHSYRLEGIGSAQSALRQSGPVSLVTADTNGNLASDGGALFAQVTAHDAGIADLEGRVAVNSAGIADLDGRVATNSAGIADLDGRVATNTADIATLDGRVDQNTADIEGISARLEGMGGGYAALSGAVQQNREGIAMAMAMDVPYVPPDREFALSTALGHFGGATAFGLSAAWRVGAVGQLDLGLGATRSYQGGRVGVTWAW